ncbi:recombinase family protein [Paenarthrobacter histidinolovorans]|uniref:recombinase family protein n=1 Tax=Paenarthrobacter histidinolovorans TaxID=43664 RepID=UPI001E42159B|nr:recombinase family protein [Paenarthrobacter histidinolovorans]
MHASGVTQARPRWQAFHEDLQPGHVLVTTDRMSLGRSTADLSSIVAVLGEYDDQGSRNAPR